MSSTQLGNKNINKCDPAMYPEFADNLTFEPIYTSKMGNKSSTVKFYGRKAFFQLPRMRVEWGFGQYDANSGWTVQPCLIGYEGSSPKIKDLYSMLTELENVLVQNARKNSFTWFRKKSLNEKTARKFLRPIARIPKDAKSGKIDPSLPLKMTLNVKTNREKTMLQTKVFLRNKDVRLTRIEDILPYSKKRIDIIPIVQLKSMTLTGDKFGFRWELEQVMVFPYNDPYDTYAFRYTSEETADEEYTLPTLTSTAPSPSNENSMNASSSSRAESPVLKGKADEAPSTTLKTNFIQDSSDEEESSELEDSDNEDSEPMVIPPKKVSPVKRKRATGTTKSTQRKKT